MIASTWLASISSIASYISLAMKPIDRSEMAMMPASAPGPMMETSSSAQMSELIERDETMMNSASGRTKATLGVVLRAARNATGSAMPMASSVPMVAMLSVSHSGHHSWSM